MISGFSIKNTVADYSEDNCRLSTSNALGIVRMVLFASKVARIKTDQVI